MNMDSETRTAIQRSINEIWKPRAEGKEVNVRCFLCELNQMRCHEAERGYKYNDRNNCKYCIIKEVTGSRQCSGTNYYAWRHNNIELRPWHKKTIKQAKIMVEFLEGLLDDRG